MTGYAIYDPSNTVTKYRFDKAVGSRGTSEVDVTKNENRLELRTFGRFPYVYYAGETDFATFNLTGTFIYDEETGKTPREQVDELKALIKQRKTLWVDNGQGQTFKCDVQLTSESAPNLYDEVNMQYITVKVKCTQIDI